MSDLSILSAAENDVEVLDAPPKGEFVSF
ncbi:MAG: hypothetical protein JWQ13_2187, partial [Ramlibacter sp.]|nr:hypothetical protein [Ramlibacter sp.]